MAPNKKMILRGDVNRIYDDKYRSRWEWESTCRFAC